jgi:hypothetical protein
MTRALLFLLPATLLQQDRRLTLEIRDDAWGGARRQDIGEVLQSAASELWTHVPGRALPVISVGRGHDTPITLFKRGPKGEIQVLLNVEGMRWAQFAFQFAHEFGHILCDTVEAENPNLWFEESVCEAASLFALRAMAKTWQTAPPYPNWKDYSGSLADYAKDRSRDFAIPAGRAFREWFRENEPGLRADPHQRAKNGIVALRLLPLFEKEPRGWASLAALNAVRPQAGATLADYLRSWRDKSAPAHRGFIAEVAAQFDVTLD